MPSYRNIVPFGQFQFVEVELKLMFRIIFGGFSMSMHESAEMYLETIYTLSLNSTCVRSIDVAEALNYSRPSVSRAVGLLKKDGYLLMNEEGFLTLTEEGRALAEQIYERHTVLTAALEALGVDKETAAEDACKIEHDISDRTFEAIKAHMKTYMPK